jgi:hypothetical protein
VVQHVQLCNLQSLFLALESKRDAVKEGGGDPLDKVALKYREPLPDAAAAILRSSIAVGAIDLGIFIPLLREFANEQLCTGKKVGLRSGERLIKSIQYLQYKPSVQYGTYSLHNLKIVTITFYLCYVCVMQMAGPQTQD